MNSKNLKKKNIIQKIITIENIVYVLLKDQIKINLLIENQNKIIKQLKDKNEKISKAIEIIRNDTTLNPQRQRDRLTNILESNKEE